MQEIQETQVRFLGREDPLEKEMATHCNLLAWRIPWTEEPGGLQSTGMLVLILTAVMMMTLQLAAQYYDSRYYSFVFPLLGVIVGLLAVLLICNIILNFKTRNVHQSVFKKACGYVRPVLWLGVIVNVVYWQLYAGSLL